MSLTVHLNIVNQEEEIFSGLVESVIAPATEGDVGIFPNHTAFLSPLRTGEMTLNLPSGEQKFYYVAGGFIEVLPDRINVLADKLLRAREIDEAAAQKAIQHAEKILASGQSTTIDYQKAQAELEDSQAKLRILQHMKNKRS